MIQMKRMRIIQGKALKIVFAANKMHRERKNRLATRRNLRDRPIYFVILKR